MRESILFILIHNAALLITLAYIYSLLSVREKEQTPLWKKLCLFGWAVHLALVPLLLLLPNASDAAQFARAVWIPFLLLYPAATLLLGRVWSSRLQREQAAAPHHPETAKQGRLDAQLWQAQKMEAVGRLASGVAHDYNNKLQVILGYSEIALQKEDLAEDVRRFLQEIQVSAQHATLLTMQLMAFAREQPIHPCVSDLNDVIEQMLKMLKQLVGEDIDLAWNPAGDIWAVKVDPTQLDQILVNLAINAREAMPDTGKLTIETRNVVLDQDCREMFPESVPGEYVMVAISDTGRGIDPDVIDRVFEPFFTTKREGDGSGLGLAMVYGALQQNGGFAHVHSAPGEGALFQLYFPRAHDPSRKARPADATDGPLRGKGEMVLVVEDERLVLDIVRVALESQGYRVIPADGPATALKRVAEHGAAFALMITDVVMPDMNGRALYEKIAAEHPDMKVMYMSGYTADAVVRRGILDEGAVFIHKPFSVEALCAKVHEMLNT